MVFCTFLGHAGSKYLVRGFRFSLLRVSNQRIALEIWEKSSVSALILRGWGVNELVVKWLSPLFSLDNAL